MTDEHNPGFLGRILLLPVAFLMTWFDLAGRAWGDAKWLLFPDPEPQTWPPEALSLSLRAQKLLERVRDPNNWYVAYRDDTPKAMQELVDAGLVVIGGRVNLMTAAYIPVGTEPFQREVYPDPTFR